MPHQNPRPRTRRRRPRQLSPRQLGYTGPADALALDAGYYLDPAKAERVRLFFHAYIRHSKGQWAGQPFDLLPWQWRRIIYPLFAWLRPDGTRRFRRAYIEIPKKSGKSTLFAALSLYLLIADDEPGAEIYSAAADREQASIVFLEAANMVEQSPPLIPHLQVIRSTKRLLFPARRAIYRALSADVPTKEGLNSHAILFDELHAQKRPDLWNTLRYAGAGRRQPLLAAITTAGYDRHSICWEQHQYARGVEDGTIADPHYLPVIYAADAADDWTHPDTWKKANPSWGITIDPKQFAEDCAEAQTSPARENVFKRYRLNLWTEQETRAITREAWDACADTVTDAELEGRDCWGGLDLSTTTDLSALVLVWRLDELYHARAYFWAPSEGVKRRASRDRVPYDTWLRAGHITATPGEVTDYDVIRRDINALNTRYRIREIGLDRWNATHLASQLTGDGLTITAIGQGFASMTAPTKALEAAILSRNLRHDSNPVLNWMAGNLAIQADAAGNWKPDKKRSADKIDGMVALIMALGRATAATATPESIYETRPMLTL